LNLKDPAKAKRGGETVGSGALPPIFVPRPYFFRHRMKIG